MDGRVKRLLSDPKKWTKCAFARDEGGKESTYSQACSFCLVGAVKREYPCDKWDEAVRKLDKATSARTAVVLPEEKCYFGVSATAFNDLPTTTHEDIMKLLDETGV